MTLENFSSSIISQHYKPLPGPIPSPNRKVFTRFRAGSRLAGTFEAAFFRPFRQAELFALLTAAEKFDREQRRQGERVGPLGVGVEILRYMIGAIDFATGRLDPAIKTICRETRRSNDAVTGGLNKLQRHGFLDWVRRKVETGLEGKGPQVRQITNAYRLSLPAHAKPAAPPVPEDAELRAMARQAFVDECERVPSPALEAAIARGRKACTEPKVSDLKERDSGNQRVTGFHLFLASDEAKLTPQAAKIALERARRRC